MLHNRFSSFFFTAPFLLGACGSDVAPVDPGTGQAEQAVSVCFFTESAITCAPDPTWNDDDGSDLRTRVEDFYPSACADGDGDRDGVPDFLDPDRQDDDGHHVDDHLRCHECNRGPGTEGDFRLEVDGDEVKLDRGRVYLVDGNQLTVPTPDGSLTIILSPGTRIDDGIPAPGSEIRAEGVMGPDGELLAERVKVLCPAPAPMPPDEVPDGCDPVTPPVE